VRTALGYQSGSGAQSAIVRLGLAPHVSARLGRFVDRVVPADFAIDAGERRVLNALGEQEYVPARVIGQLIDIADAVSFMEELVKKLEAYGLGDLVEPGNPMGGEPTYRLRRT
jgi:phosphopentomutase